MHSGKTIKLSSLGLRVLTAYVVGALLSIAVAVAGAFWAVEHDVLADLELRERAGVLAASVGFDRNGIPVSVNAGSTDQGWIYEELPDESAFRILDEAGVPVLVSGAGTAFWSSAGSNPSLKRGVFTLQRGGGSLHGATEPFSHKGRQWYLQFATSERLMKLIQQKFALPYLGTGIGIFSALLTIAFGIVAYLTLRHALKPLHEISRAAAAISPRSMHARLQADEVPLEISPLVDSFNKALERLESGFRVQQEFLTTAAHELKTPLALIRGQIELGVDAGNRDVLLRDVSHMGRQVQQLLHLAEASEAQNYQFSSVDAGTLVREVSEYLDRLASSRGINIEVVVTPGLAPVRADSGALFTLVKNLLENAIQHCRAGGIVLIRVEQGLMSVLDEGAGVPAEDLPKLFTRFWRGKERRDLGAGLGLSICQEIAMVHGWGIRARRGETGMAFEVDMPGTA
jgi:signal transduction histidine kinase